MYRFRELDISNVGPFGEDSVLGFRDGLTLICAGTGLGKTTIARALRGDNPDAKPEYIGNLNPSIPDWIIYYDELVELPYGGGRWSALTELLATEMFQNLDWHQLENDMTFSIRKMLEKKILEHKMTKFSGVISTPQQIEVKLEKDGCFNVFDNICGRDLNLKFQAQGERTVLYFAINRAIRMQLPTDLDVPFVIDSYPGWLEMSLLSKVQGVIVRMADQVIWLENCAVNDELELTANYEIRHEADSEKSKIVACQ